MNTAQETKRVDTAGLVNIDPEFSKLHRTSSPVAVYRYDASSHLWKKTDTIGSLYLYERHVHPQLGIIVMNQRNENNFLQKFDSNAIFVMHQPYLLIRAVKNIVKDPRDGQEIIHCIWFNEPKDCMASANILRNMGLKFEGEGNTFDKVGEQSRVQLSDNSPSSMGNHAGNHLYQILRTGTKEPIDECDFLGGALSDKRRESNGPGVPLLTKEQFRRAMIHLFQTDYDFVTKIHSGYEDLARQ